MKKKGLDRVERRRTLLELNLVSDARPRAAVGRRGCLSFLTPSLLAMGVAVAIAVHISGLG